MNVILIGQKDSKRTIYFLKAARELGVKVDFFPFHSPQALLPAEGFVKIDPLKYTDSDLSNLNKLIQGYTNYVTLLSQNKRYIFLNKPSSILDTLDKKKCKIELMKKGIPVTPMVQEDILDIHRLREYIRNHKIYHLFIKPRYGSGAAGVIAYRFNPKTESEIIYTSIQENQGRFLNTKKISKIYNPVQIESLVNFVLSQEAVIEKWIPKPTYNEFSYDIRVLWQLGKVDFMVARCSASPITNLHLNNRVLKIEELTLPPSVIDQIEELCKNAVSCFDGLNSAGVDILLHGKHLEPRIIEINAQGDQIYQDLFKENKIYKNQIRRMVNNHE